MNHKAARFLNSRSRYWHLLAMFALSLAFATTASAQKDKKKKPVD